MTSTPRSQLAAPASPALRHLAPPHGYVARLARRQRALTLLLWLGLLAVLCALSA